MYGTVARMQVKPGQVDALVDLLQEWEKDRRPSIAGAVASYVYRTDRDPNTLMLAVVFQDRETYTANADDPAQDKWYRRMRELLSADPEWTDGEVIHSST